MPLILFAMSLVGNNHEVAVLGIGTGSTFRGSVNVVENETSSLLWHRRLSYMSKKGMDNLAKKNLLSGSHPPSRKPDLLELVHYDLCGPFKALVERQTGKKLKCIRSDNGGEYIGSFDRYCREQGIQHQKTHPKTPKLNGLAGRINRTLVERVRCMLSDAKLPDSFWAETLNTIAYVINLSPIVALNGNVPDRVWSVEKKLVRSRDVIFFEDQTIEDLDKAEKVDSQNSESLVDVDPVPLTIPLGENIQVDIEDGDPTQNDQYAIDAQVQDDVVGQKLTIIDSPESSLRRSTREKISSSRYSPNEYVLLTDEGEP
ncbi:hypothetical protein KY285_013541 [Solanum tuberosum]|nr:hypothetical protein KY285_013541 [Solanum tuberosum]